MRVFLTGASGFVGSAVVPELLKAGHQVIGLARSDASAKSLAAQGVHVQRGDVTDLESLRSGVAASDGVIHCAFIHDFTKFAENCEIDRRAIEAMGAALEGSDRPFLVTSGTALPNPGRLATEDDRAPASSPIPRVATEQAADAIAARGVRVAVVRLPQVHGKGDHAFNPMLINLAREKGVAAYVGDGSNRWPAVHRLDAGLLYRLALEKATRGARYHCVAEEGIPLREITEMIGKHLRVPVVSKSPAEAAAHFGWFAHFAQMNNPTSSRLTQERLGWRPTQPGLLWDLDQDYYYKS